MTKSRKNLILVKLHHICIFALILTQIINTAYAEEEDEEKEDDDDDPLLGYFEPQFLIALFNNCIVF